MLNTFYSFFNGKIMVVISVNKQRLIKLTRVDNEKIKNIVEMLGGEVKREDENTWDFELYPDRPDLYSIFGLSRAIRQYVYNEKRSYRLYDSKIFVNVDEKLKNIRPYIGCAVIKNIYLDDEAIKEIMDLQEKLHLSVGRNREKIAIGIHDLDNVTPPFSYAAHDPEDISFIPLGFSEKMNLKEIIGKHPKGIEYGWIIKDYEKYPVITDKNGDVLSFPPIINGTLTQLKENTKNIFIDVTGIELFTIIITLNLVVTAILEIGGRPEKVKVEYQDGTMILPSLGFEKFTINEKEIENVLGVKVDKRKLKNILEKMGYRVNIKNNIVEVPPYRVDVMHSIDIIEDLAKGLGYDNIPQILPKKFSQGYESEVENIKEKMRMIMIGLNYIEVVNLTLTSPKRNFENFDLEERDSPKIINPVTNDQTMIRTWLIPMLMETLENNRHRNLPQRIFEVGEVYDRGETINLAGSSIHSSASFTEIKGTVGKILEAMGLTLNIKESDLPFLISGRQAYIMVDGKNVGFFGEVHPRILERYNLGNPAVVFEINLEKIYPQIFKNRLNF